MKLAVWHTGHAISDTIAASLSIGFGGDSIHTSKYDLAVNYDVNIAYGILRGCAEVYEKSKHWFELDNGYFNPGHYAGYYRISYLGTQPRYMAGVEADHSLVLQPWRASRGLTLICPPTPQVCQFYNVDAVQWLREAISKCSGQYVIKHKGTELSFNGISKVVTFNSSVGWQALQQGIIVDSHPEYSVVGSYFKYLGIDNDIDFLHSDREPLFRFCRAHQFTLAEIEQGRAWSLINHYLATSAGIAEKQSVLT